MAEVLKENTSLTKLDLSRTHKHNVKSKQIKVVFTGNKIRSSGGNAIWEGLKANTALTELNLGVS